MLENLDIAPGVEPGAWLEAGGRRYLRAADHLCCALRLVYLNSDNLN